METKGFFQFEIVRYFLVSSFCFTWIPMLWVYGHYIYFYSYSAGINFRRQNLTTTDVRFWRLKSVPALEKWNESGFRPPLWTYRLNWAKRTSWGWWDDWDDTVLQTQDSKFEPSRSEAEHATSRSRRLPTILTFTRGWGRNIFVSFEPPRPGTEPRTLAWKAAVLTTTLGPPPLFFPKIRKPKMHVYTHTFPEKNYKLAAALFVQRVVR